MQKTVSQSELRCYKKIALVFLLVFLVLFGNVTQAISETVSNDPVYIAPKIPSDADVYDPEHPENLEANQLYAKSAILIEATTGKVIFEKNADEVMYPASTTKILTAYLALVNGDLNQTVYHSQTAANVPEDGSYIGLEVGESINLLDLIYATMIRSGNEGANLIAESVSGNIQNFVALMNETATNIGLRNTHFMNPHGYHEDYHVSTARDMATIAQLAMQKEEFRKIAKTSNFSLPRSNLSGSRVLISSADVLFNPNLEENNYYYPFATGIKTGYHSRAGYCFVGAAEKEGVELISVLFYTSKGGRWTDTAKLMEYGFSQYVSVTPQEMYEQNPVVLETSGFSLSDEDVGRLTLRAVARGNASDTKIVATKAEVEEMSRKLLETVIIEYVRDFRAPITEGETLAHMTYYPTDGTPGVTYDLVADRSIEKRANAPLTIEEIQAEVMADPNPFPAFSVELLVIFTWPLVILGILIYIPIRRRREKKRPKISRVPKPKNRYFR